MPERLLQPEPPATTVGNPDENFLSPRPFHDRAAFPVLLCIVVYAGLRNLAQAATKPLWFDELITQVMTRQSSLSALWSALKSAADSNPPGFYLFERAAAALPVNEHIAYRLASVVAFSFTLICLYWLVERRSGSLRALLCASLLLVTPLYTRYADEARPYSVLIACISFALVCYLREPGALWTFGLFASLTLAICLHYYAVFALLPFLAAELLLTCQTRRPRYFIWTALFLSLAPVLIFRPLWQASKTYYGPHIWSRPQFTDVLDSYGSFFQVETPWGLALVALCVAAVLLALWPRASRANSVEGREIGPLQEPVLALGFIAFPLIVYVSAELIHGAAVTRYFLCAILGIVLGLAYVLDWLPSRAVLAAAALLLVVIVSQEAGFWVDFAHSAPTAGAALSLQALTDSVPQEGLQNLPLVVSDSMAYLVIQHYASPELRRRLVALIDPASAVLYVGNDSVDKGMLTLRPLMPLNADDFSQFAATHRSFLLYSNASDFDWLPMRLLEDGDTMRLLAAQEYGSLYLVELNPN